MGKVVGIGVGFLIAVIVVFSIGFSSGLSWGGNTKAYSAKDATLAERLNDEQMEAVRNRLNECLPVKLPSYLDACLQGEEDDWKPTEEDKKHGY